MFSFSVQRKRRRDTAVETKTQTFVKRNKKSNGSVWIWVGKIQK